VSSATIAGTSWLDAHARTTKKGKTVLKIDGQKRKLPRAKLARIARAL